MYLNEILKIFFWCLCFAFVLLFFNLFVVCFSFFACVFIFL